MAEFHIISILIRAWPACAQAVADRIAATPGLEVHAVQDGKIVLTLEAASEHRIVDTIDQLQRLDGVLAANLVFHHVEPAAEREGPFQ